MPGSLQELIVWLTYPLALTVALLAVAALVMVFGCRKTGLVVATVALGWSALWSIPQMSDWLRHTLERRHPLVDEDQLPRADAIVVLGGGEGYRWLDWENVDPEDLRSSRLAAGARAWLAGRAPVIVLTGGGAEGRTEADRMAAAITLLGVPESALLVENESRDTRDNARFTTRLARQHGIHQVLLVTSAVHMPRAELLFRQAGLEPVPFPVPEIAARGGWVDRWVPSRRALWRSGRALKEYLALIAARMQA